MTTLEFALVTCPHSPAQIQAERPLLSWLPETWMPGLARFLDVSVRGGVQFSNISGCIMDFPLMPGQLGQEKKAAQAAKKIKNAGAKVVGLEIGMRSLAPVFVQQGLAVSRGSALHVTAALSLIDKLLASGLGENTLIVDPLTPPGPVCARILADRVRHLVLMGNFQAPLQRLAKRILMETGTAPVITKFDPSMVQQADLVIDLAGTDFNRIPLASTAVVWQPLQNTEGYCGKARIIFEALIGLSTQLKIEGDLPAGLLRASTAEALLQGLGIEALWPRNLGEVTVDQVLRVWHLAAQANLPIAGYLSHGRLTLLPRQLKFDK